jgi:hypothetical protein
MERAVGAAEADHLWVMLGPGQEGASSFILEQKAFRKSTLSLRDKDLEFPKGIKG